MKKLQATLVTLLVAGCAGCSGEMGTEQMEAVGQTHQALLPAATTSETPIGADSALSGDRVRALLVKGNRVYVGGTFTIGSKKNLVAFQLPDGPYGAPTLITSFAPNPNGAVWDLVYDGNTIYAGGTFTSIGGKSRIRLAAVNADTGADAGLSADVNGPVPNCPTCGQGMPIDGTAGVQALAIVFSSGFPMKQLVVGGNFSTLKGTTRYGLGAIDLGTGAVSTSSFTGGVAGGFVSTLSWDQGDDRLFVGGTFSSISGIGRNCIAATSPTGWVSSVVFDIGATCGTSLPSIAQVREVTVDSRRLIVAVGGKDVAGSNRVAAYVAAGTNEGTMVWPGTRVQGDAQAVDAFNGTVYFGFHDGLFNDGGDVPGDPYKMAALNASNGGMLNDSQHSSEYCGPAPQRSPEACWAPTDTSPNNAGFWGVLELAHYTNSYGTRLLVGGEVDQWQNVNNTGLFATFPPSGWTPWLDRDDPSGNGDGEHLSSFQTEGKVCMNPTGIECRRVSDKVPAASTGEVLVCNTTAGLVCLNADQGDHWCDDYEVRFLCP